MTHRRQQAVREVEYVNPKPIYKSKTLWLNVIALVLLALATPEIVGVLPADWREEIAAAAAFLNILNRFLTVQPVSATGGPPPVAVPSEGEGVGTGV